MNMIADAGRMAGIRIGTVMRRSVVSALAPHIRAESSSAAFICRKAGVNRITATGTEVAVR